MQPREATGTSLRPPARVLASAADGAIDLFRRSGGDVEAILGRAGVTPETMDNPNSELGLKQYCALFEEAARQTARDSIGLEFGCHFEPRRLGALGYAALASPTLAAALRNMETYFPAHQDQSSFTVISDDDIHWLSYRILDPRIVQKRQDAELSLGMFCNIFRAALGPNWSPIEVRFEHARPDSWSEHERYFGAPVQFGRRTNAFAFRRSDLLAAMPGADPYLFSVIRPLLESRCRTPDNPEDIAATIRNQIKLNLGSTEPTLPRIAAILGLTTRELQRQLGNLGVAFSDLLAAAREELALHYLDEQRMPLTEIALNLGYSELSAFSRAFRNWTGMSPQRYRQLHARR